MSPDIEILLRDESWVRALAQQLVRDGAAADDLVQEAWLAARRHAPDERSEEGLRR